MIIRSLYSFLDILRILFFALKGCDNEWIYGGKMTKYQGLELETFHEKIGQLLQVNNSQPRVNFYYYISGDFVIFIIQIRSSKMFFFKEIRDWIQ